MNNRAAFTAADLQQIFGSTALVPDYFASVGVSTDTRTMQPGCIFVALRGERFDAHNNIGEAIIKGAACVVFEQRWLNEWNEGVGKEFPSFARVVVDDSLKALGELARYHRMRFRIPVVAVAGSNGKTTTKDILAHILSTKYRTLSTKANYNNRIGTPLTLLELNKLHKAAVVEIGTNEPGEIATLAEMVSATHGVITNIGEEHLEKLIDLDGVEREECALFEDLQKRGATCIVNLDDERLNKFSSAGNCVRYSTKQTADFYAQIRFTNTMEPILDIHAGSSATEVLLHATGYAAALNAVAASACTFAVGMNAEEICTALANYTSPAAHGYARMIVENVGQLTILNDCYNANPASMRMALSTLESYPSEGKKTALLGDMRELGRASQEQHIEILRSALTVVDQLFIIGEEMKRAAAHVDAAKITVCESHDHAAQHVMSYAPQQTVLVKASRGMELERSIEKIKSLSTLPIEH